MPIYFHFCYFMFFHDFTVILKEEYKSNKEYVDVYKPFSGTLRPAG